MHLRTFVVAVFFLACAGSAGAQNLTLEFRDGKVSLDATNVPVRTILSEWGRLGGTRVVGGERITGAPLTIHLESVPEAQALEIVLRNVAGYMAAPRSAANSAGASVYDRIMVLATSSAPAATATNNRQTPTQNAGRGRGPGNVPQQQQQADPDDQPPAPAEAADTGVNEPQFQFPQQNPFQAAQPGQPGPFGTPMGAPNTQAPVIQFGQPPEQGISINPAPPQATPVLQFPGAQPGTNPGGFGLGSPTPGVILQPQPGQPVQPGQVVRPPGAYN